PVNLFVRPQQEPVKSFDRNAFMEIVKLSGDEWRTLVVIPAVISLAVNLLTPLTQRAATALIVKTAGGMRGGLKGLLRIRIRQINEELAELRELKSNNSALLKHYQSTVVYLNFGLLILFLSPIIGIIFQALATKYIDYLPEFYVFFARVPGVIFVLV